MPSKIPSRSAADRASRKSVPFQIAIKLAGAIPSRGTRTCRRPRRQDCESPDPNKDPLTNHEYPAPSEKSSSLPVGWDQGHSWDALNAQLPVGPTSRDNSSKNITLSVTNNITVNGPDPQSDAAIVGVHPDRTSNDLSRILQCAFQRGSELVAFPLAASRPGRPSSLLNELTVPRAPFEDD
jgi:hypothetical protein